MIFKNRKGIVPFAVIGFILLFVLVIYLGLYLPIPAFTALRQTINYFLVLILWFTFQFVLIYGAYKGIMYAKMAYHMYKKDILGWALNVKKYISSH